MTHVRMKRGRPVLTSTPQSKALGRRASAAPAQRGQIDPRAPADRLVEALILLHLLGAGIGVGASHRALRARLGRARAALAKEPGGAERGRHRTVLVAAIGDGGLLRTVRSAAVEARPFAMRAALLAVRLSEEFNAGTDAGLALLGSAGAWLALSEMLREQAFSLGPAGDGFGDTLKLAERCSSAARLDLLAGRQIEQAARDESPRSTVDLTAAFARVRERRAQAEREAAEDAAAAENSSSQTRDDGEKQP